MCVVALILGMLMYHMLKNVCGCKNVVEGVHPRGCPDNTISHDGSGSGPVCDASTLARDASPQTCDVSSINKSCSTYSIVDTMMNLDGKIINALANDEGKSIQEVHLATTQNNIVNAFCSDPCILDMIRNSTCTTEQLAGSFPKLAPFHQTLVPTISEVCKIAHNQATVVVPPVVVESQPAVKHDCGTNNRGEFKCW
jgi:hypothetical protein